MVRQSSKALEVFLRPKQFDLPKSDSSQKHLQVLVERLRDLMHLACAFKIASSTKRQLEERGWGGEIDLKSHLDFGNLSMTLESKYVAECRREGPVPEEGKRIVKERSSAV